MTGGPDLRVGNVVMLRPTQDTRARSQTVRGFAKQCLRRVGAVDVGRDPWCPGDIVGTAEHPRLVAARLVGQRSPMVKMENWHWRGWVHEMTRGCLYVYPGGGSAPVDPVEDVALHQAFRDHCKGVEIRGVSTRSARLQLHSLTEYELEHSLFSDDELRLAKALGLPTFRSEGQWFYARLIAVINAGRIARVFYPVDDVNCVAQASAWLIGRPLRDA